jgi:hypothetical protein
MSAVLNYTVRQYDFIMNKAINDDELFFKRKEITNSNIELTFHRVYPWIFNTSIFPVVKYTLLNCENIKSLDWELLDIHDDGVVISTINFGDLYIFHTTDIGGREFQVTCERVIREERNYDVGDLTDLINEINRQHDAEIGFFKRLQSKIDDVRYYLEKELDTNNLKLGQADWLSEEKKHFLEGQNSIIDFVLSSFKPDSLNKNK